MLLWNLEAAKRKWSSTVSIIKEIPEDYLDTITQVSRDDQQSGPNQ